MEEEFLKLLSNSRCGGGGGGGGGSREKRKRQCCVKGPTREGGAVLSSRYAAEFASGTL